MLLGIYDKGNIIPALNKTFEIEWFLSF